MDKRSFLKTGVNQDESLKSTFARLETSEAGLSSAEAERRLDLLGSNDFKVSRFSSMFSELLRVALAATAFSILLIGILIPFSPVGRLMGFAPMPLGFFLLLIVIVGIYLSIVELAKRRVFHSYIGRS